VPRPRRFHWSTRFSPLLVTSAPAPADVAPPATPPLLNEGCCSRPGGRLRPVNFRTLGPPPGPSCSPSFLGTPSLRPPLAYPLPVAPSTGTPPVSPGGMPRRGPLGAGAQGVGSGGRHEARISACAAPGREIGVRVGKPQAPSLRELCEPGWGAGGTQGALVPLGPQVLTWHWG